MTTWDVAKLTLAGVGRGNSATSPLLGMRLKGQRYHTHPLADRVKSAIKEEKMNFPYPPGRPKGRDYSPSSYNPRQEATYQAINTAYYAWVHGRTASLMPTPGEKVDMEKFQKWKAKFIGAQKQENATRGRGITRGIVGEDWPENLWLWLYQRLIRVPV